MINRKFKIIRRSGMAAALGLLLVACGGGGGGSGGSTTPAAVQTGVFTDAVVSGVSYSTASRSGLTDDGGRFNYLPGEMVTFSIGGIVLGSALAGPVVTPLTLVGTTDVTNQQVINIVRLLMTVDADGNPGNGIQITEATRLAASGITIEFNVPVADFASAPAVVAFVASADTSNIALVDGATAQTHLSNTLASTWGLMEWGTGQWSAN